MLLKEVLEAAGVEYHESRSKKYEVTMNCPFCEERDESPDHRYRLGLNLDQGRGHCFNCDWKSNSFSFTLREFCRVFGIKRRVALRAAEPEVKEEKAPQITGWPVGYEPFLFGQKMEPFEHKAYRYLQLRGVTKLQVERHEIGYAEVGPFAGRIVFPVIGKKHRIYGCVSRAVSRSLEPKYLNTPGIKLLWNAYRKGKRAVVVEGIMDALAVERAVPWTAETVAVARLGSAITRLQLHALAKYEEVVILPDWDVPGVQGAAKLATMLLEGGKPSKICVPIVMDDRDPASMDPLDIVLAIDSAIPWSRNTERRLRLAASRAA